MLTINYKNIDENHHNIVKSMKKTGFFRIKFDEEFNFKELYKATHKFFHLTQNSKHQMLKNSSDKIYYGYFPSSLNGKEGLDFPNKLLDSDSHVLANDVQFPDLYDEKYVECIYKYYQFVHKLSLQILDILLEDSNIVDFLDETKNLSVLRLNYYPKHNKDDNAVEITEDNVKLACETHIDNSILTLLFQDHNGGLQIQNPKTKNWKTVNYISNSLIINTGSLLGLITNNKYVPVNHRVLFNINERISIPYFLCPQPNTPLEKNVTYHDFLMTSLRQRKEYEHIADYLK